MVRVWGSAKGVGLERFSALGGSGCGGFERGGPCDMSPQLGMGDVDVFKRKDLLFVLWMNIIEYQLHKPAEATCGRSFWCGVELFILLFP